MKNPMNVRAGDGIFVTRMNHRLYGKWGRVRGLMFNGEVAGTPINDDQDVIGVRMQLPDSGALYEIYNDEFRKETFAEFKRRPTGYGRTPWVLFYVIQAFCLASIIVGMLTFFIGGWVGPVMAGLVEWVLIWATKRNYQHKSA